MDRKLTRGETRSKARKLIYVENKSHQEAFEQLRFKTEYQPKELADLIAGTPSKQAYEERKAWWIIFAILLILIIGLRGVFIIQLGLSTNIELPVTLIVLFLSVVVPAFGVFAAYTARLSYFRSIGFLMILGIFSSFFTGDLGRSQLEDLISFAVTFSFILATFFAFFVPSRFRIKYIQFVDTISTDGKTKKVLNFRFNTDDSRTNDELLDDL